MNVLIETAAWNIVRNLHGSRAMEGMNVTEATSVGGAGRRIDGCFLGAAPLDLSRGPVA
ncbi:MAG: hypothetical protein ACYC61_17170 [Isosphaeraceae bacterium]